MGLPAGTAGLKRHISITMEFASRTISPVPDISRYAAAAASRRPTSTRMATTRPSLQPRSILLAQKSQAASESLGRVVARLNHCRRDLNLTREGVPFATESQLEIPAPVAGAPDKSHHGPTDARRRTPNRCGLGTGRQSESGGPGAAARSRRSRNAGPARGRPARPSSARVARSKFGPSPSRGFSPSRGAGAGPGFKLGRRRRPARGLSLPPSLSSPPPAVLSADCSDLRDRCRVLRAYYSILIACLLQCRHRRAA